MRSKTESIAGLLRGVEAAKQQREYDFAKDLKMLLDAYPKTSKRDYLALIRALIDKYSAEETAAVYAALLRKCQAGEMDAIRLWAQLQQSGGSGAAEVKIVDSL